MSRPDRPIAGARFQAVMVLLSFAFAITLGLFIWTYLQQQSFNTDQQAQDRTITGLIAARRQDSDAIARTQRALTAVNTAVIAGNTSKLQRDINLIRGLNFKVCVRINDTRGVLDLLLASRRGGRMTRTLASDLPLYQCNRGFADGAKILTPAAARAYLRVLRHGKKPGP